MIKREHDNPIRRKRKALVKDIWIASLIVIACILQFPSFAPLCIPVVFIATFVSFMVLDEADYP